MSIQLFEHCATYLHGVKPSKAVQAFSQLLGEMPAMDILTVNAVDLFDDFYPEAETCLIAGASADDRAKINTVGSAWVEYKRTHGYPAITAWRDEPGWYVEHPDTAGMEHSGWNGTGFVRTPRQEEQRAIEIAAANRLPEEGDDERFNLAVANLVDLVESHPEFFQREGEWWNERLGSNLTEAEYANLVDNQEAW